MLKNELYMQDFTSVGKQTLKTQNDFQKATETPMSLKNGTEVIYQLSFNESNNNNNNKEL